MSGEDNVASPQTLQQKGYKHKVLLTDVLCMGDIDHSCCAEESHGRHRKWWFVTWIIDIDWWWLKNFCGHVFHFLCC